jgi:Trk-type K+ transport system membrane component
MWWLCLAVLLITVTESNNYKSDPLAFSTFNIIFEVVSTYSCVGESIGYPGKSYAFCGEWHAFSKFLLLAVSVRGKIRSLPIHVDNLDNLPKETSLEKRSSKIHGP